MQSAMIAHSGRSRTLPRRQQVAVVRLIRDGLLPASQVCAGAPYIIREDDLAQPANPEGRRVSFGFTSFASRVITSLIFMVTSIINVDRITQRYPIGTAGLVAF